jgi:hypothetical protein
MEQILLHIRDRATIFYHKGFFFLPFISHKHSLSMYGSIEKCAAPSLRMGCCAFALALSTYILHIPWPETWTRKEYYRTWIPLHSVLSKDLSHTK